MGSSRNPAGSEMRNWRLTMQKSEKMKSLRVRIDWADELCAQIVSFKASADRLLAEVVQEIHRDAELRASLMDRPDLYEKFGQACDLISHINDYWDNDNEG